MYATNYRMRPTSYS